MKRLEDLPEVASRQLGGLEATPTILAKAKLRASEYRQPRMRRGVWRPALAVCAALVLCVGAAFWATEGVAPASAPGPRKTCWTATPPARKPSPQSSRGWPRMCPQAVFR